MLDWEKVVINKKRVIALLISLACLFASGSRQPVIAAQKPTQAAPIVIPFEFVTRHIVIKVRINNSDPLRFILDTGDKVAIVDLNRAQSLGLTLQNEVRVGGAGAGTLKGSHDKDKFTYSGPGEIIPIRLNGLGYPVVEGEVTAAGPPAVKAEFLLDIGSGGSLALHTPFVEQQHLPAPDQKTIRAIGGGGAGGKVTGKIGRIAELKIGTFQIQNPATLFSEDRAGAFATSQLQGNIGAQILTKFKVFLDYSRNRIILEPNASFKDLIAPASAGLRLVAVGADYKTFRVEDLLEASPATEAGLQVGDLVLTVDGHQASELTLSSLHESFEKPGPHKLTVRRGDQTLQLTVTSRRMV